MAAAVVLPKMGLTAEDGEIVRWLVQVGEPVRAGQPLVEVETYKATVEVEAPADGVLRRVLAAGTTVPGGAPIGIVAGQDEDIGGLALWGEATERVVASPAARKRALELGVDLAALAGASPGGRIGLEDVERAADATVPATGRRVPLNSMRRAIAELMTLSASVPQFTLEATAEVGSAESLSDLVVVACARALREHPGLRASFDGDAIVEHEDVNVGIAVSVERGLLVPVLRQADRLSLPELRAERERLTAAAHAGRLSAADLTGATFTISNLGPLGVERFRALVVPPQAAILAVGAAVNGRLALSLSCDHRVVDGAPAARFLHRVVELLGRSE